MGQEKGNYRRGCSFHSLIKPFRFLVVFSIKFTFKNHVSGVQRYMPITVATGLQRQEDLGG